MKTHARAAVDSYDREDDAEEGNDGARLAPKALAQFGSGAPAAASGLDRWAGLVDAVMLSLQTLEHA